MNPQPDESLSIGSAVAAFMGALHVLGQASGRWSRRRTDQTATEMGAALDAVDTSLAMVVLAVGNGVERTRGEIAAWKTERDSMAVDSPVSRLVVPPRDWGN